MMTGEEFKAAHKIYKEKTSAQKEDKPKTWLMSDVGSIFPLEGDLESELERLRQIDMPCTVHENATSTIMRDLQAEKRGVKDEGMQGLPTPLR